MNLAVDTPDIIEIPIELYDRVTDNPESFLRNYASINIGRISPFFRDRKRVENVFDLEIKNPLDEQNLVLDDWYAPIDGRNRFIHVDLAPGRRDALGIACCHIDDYISIGDGPTELVAPHITLDFVGRIRFPGRDVIYGDVRQIFYDMVERGISIALCTFDGFHGSLDTIQILQQRRITAAHLSIDRTAWKCVLDPHYDGGVKRASTGGQFLDPWETLKSAMYQERISIPYHEVGMNELLQAEEIADKKKVDHPPRGSLDVAQAIVGSVYNAVVNEEADAIAPDSRQFYGIASGAEDRYEEPQWKPYYIGVYFGEFPEKTCISIFDIDSRMVVFERISSEIWDDQEQAIVEMALDYNRALVSIEYNGVDDPHFRSLRRRGVQISTPKKNKREEVNMLEQVRLRVQNGEIQLPPQSFRPAREGTDEGSIKSMGLALNALRLSRVQIRSL